MASILEIDPGSRITGFDVMRETMCDCEYMTSGCIQTGNGPLHERLYVVFHSVREAVHIHSPIALSIEQVFMARGVDSALRLGQARGAAIVAVMEKGLSMAEYTASQAKQAVAGTGGVNKQRVRVMIMRSLKLTQKPQIDASDALTVVLCHAHTQQNLVPHGLVGAR